MNTRSQSNPVSAANRYLLYRSRSNPINSVSLIVYNFNTQFTEEKNMLLRRTYSDARETDIIPYYLNEDEDEETIDDMASVSCDIFARNDDDRSVRRRLF